MVSLNPSVLWLLTGSAYTGDKDTSNMAALISFMESPLVSWVCTFSEDKEPVDFQELFDGVFLNDVMTQIDHRDLDIDTDIKRVTKDSNAKIQNWSVLIRHIYNYYQDVLQQLVVMEIPDIFAMVKEPTKESSLKSMEKILLLLLGCSVQCIHKEDYINIIKSMDIQVQQAMVSFIQQITDNVENILPLSQGDDHSGVLDKELYMVIQSVTQQRDALTQQLLLLTQERDYYQQELTDHHGRSLTPPVHLEKYHLYQEVTEWKNKTNKLMEEIQSPADLLDHLTSKHSIPEEKSKQISELQDDLNITKQQYLHTKSENMCLSKDAKAVQSYRDELDVLREKAVKLDKIEKDIQRYKEKLGELDFYKSRVEELRKDNDVLAEARSHLDEQLASSQKKLESITDELVRYQVKLEESNMEKEELTKKLQEVLDENSLLEFEKSKITEGSGMHRMLSISSIDFASQQQIGGSLSEELKDTMVSQVTRLEMEKDELKQELSDAKCRLCDAQQMLQKVQSETEKEISRKMAELELQTNQLRKRTTKELTAEYHERLQEIEERSLELKRKMSEEFKDKVAQLENEKQQLKSHESEYKKKLNFIDEAWRKDRDEVTQLKQENQRLAKEMDYFRSRMRGTQMDCQQRIQELEHQVDKMEECSGSRQEQIIHVCKYCRKAIRFDGMDSASEQDELETGSMNGEDLDSFSSRSRRKMLVSQSVQTSPSPAWISYSELGNEHQSPEPNNNKPIKSKSGSRSKFLDILRSKGGRQGSPVPERPATVLGTVHENRPSMTKNAGSPSCRSMPTTPGFGDGPFRRGDRLRATIQHGGCVSGHHNRLRPASDYVPFSRGDRLRSTMPEKKTVYVTPERRQHLAPSGSRSSLSSLESTLSLPPKAIDLEQIYMPPEVDTSLEKLSERLESDKDSGCATSPDTPASDEATQSSPRDLHRILGFKVVSSEVVRTQMRMSSQAKTAEWQILVSKVVDLQNKNQQLSVENSSLRKSLNAIKFTNDRIDLLEKRNLDLEVENRKLRKIIETMQSSFSGLNPYDKRTYHFYSNV
ncbi:hypothetical protein LSH36_43g06000 [Paralvinella palmiformis]|uniref:HOOK N-terminal domain-containing protein n=1 Tax=Paralvinella palmiformis TaxID=53620 RepID=A0AAD9K727_9ANNE|nr:hypothetical protein LSH36_43g06000 [Paralvinella palmiformis]